MGSFNKTVITTEKPSVAMEFARVLGVHGEKHDGYIEDDRYIITWCIGHLVTMAYPEAYDEELKKWKMETLPFLPKNYKYEVISNVKKQFNVIKKIYNRSDIAKILYAGDPAREGIYIQTLVRQMTGVKDGIDERVVWIDSQTEEEIKRGIKEAKPLSEYKNLSDSGYMRAIEDYALGINFSRALSVKYAKLLNPTQNVPIAVGRVMSFVLGTVVRREKEIENFKSESFYKINSIIKVDGIEIKGGWKVDEDSKLHNSPKLYNETGFKTRSDAEAFIKSLSNQITIESMDVTEEKKHAPFLYDLAELQAECTKTLKLSPDETLQIAQTLYEKKLTTYPRTSANVLSTAIAKEIRKNITGLLEYDKVKPYVNKILNDNRAENIHNTKYTNDSKIADHYAIIPTGNLNELSSLDEMEAAVFDMIVRRFLGIFCPPATYKKVSIVEKDTNERFYVSEKVLTSKGFLVLYENSEAKNEEMLNVLLNGVKKGQQYTSEYSIHEGETKPPKRYTSGSMILVMKHAGQLIEDEELRTQIKKDGIGTEATRAEVIKKLVKIGYLKLDKKTQILTPDAMGYMVYEVMNLIVPELLDAKMTANWEKGLNLIADGKIKKDDYYTKLDSYIRKGIEKIKNNDKKEVLEQLISPYKGKGKVAAQTFKVNAECYLIVPFEDKDKVKELGAFFDTDRKAWYVPKGKDKEIFKKWITDEVPKKVGKKMFLKVPFEDKDEVKRIGAKWDKEKKSWYITSDMKEKFTKWIAKGK